MTAYISPKARKRIAAAAGSRRHWEQEMEFRGGADSLAVAYRWLCALRKVKRSFGSGQRPMAEAYLDDIANRMVSAARAVSDIDRMTDEEIHEAYRQWRQRQWSQ